jgi:KUP system potassium uptake protein
LLAAGIAEYSLPFEKLIEEFNQSRYPRVDGTAIYMSGRPGTCPLALSHNVKHNKVIHERVVLITFTTRDVPHVPHYKRLVIDEPAPGLYRIVVSLGFMDDPDFGSVVELAREKGLDIDPNQTTFFLGREIVLATRKLGMSIWREKLFAFMGRNAQSPVSFYKLPAKQVMEVGIQVEI